MTHHTRSLMSKKWALPAGTLLVALWSIALCAVFWCAVRCAQASALTPPQRTNLVVIMTDNQGPWTLGCYGNSDVRTPNIDRLANEGMLFQRAFASNAVCSPTRATFLTGLLPSQHGVHCYLQANRLQIGPQARDTLADFTSLGEVLQGAG